MEGWLRLATMMDLATHEVIGCAMAEHMRADLVVDAIAATEAFFVTLKAEIATPAWATRAQARADVFLYVEAHYNR